MGLRNVGLRGQERRAVRRSARRVGVGAAGLLIIAGTTTLFDASSFGSGSAPPTENLSCNDTWTGDGSSADWDSAANWTNGVPSGARVDLCISGDANVVLSDASFSVGKLMVSAGSSLTIGTASTASTAGTASTASTASTTSTAPSLTVSSGLQNDGSLTVEPSGTSGQPALTLDGPVTNTGTLTVNGAVGIGSAPSTSVTNEGSIGVAPGGLINVDGSSTITNGPDGLLAFGIDGPPTSLAAYGRITNGTLSLGGSADPVFENGFTPSPGVEYFVDTGSSTGTFTSVLYGATADYSHAGEVGLTGGAPATVTVTGVTSTAPAGSLYGHAVRFTATVMPESGSDPTGSVSFDAGGLPLGSAPVTTSAAGVTTAALDISSLPVGSDSISATYGGDVLFSASTSPDMTQVVTADPTSITITPSSASPEPGQPVIDTATVSQLTPGVGTPTGTVSFTDDGSPVTGCQSLSLPAVAPLQATCTETYGSRGSQSIVASYSGDDDNAASTVSLVQALGQVPTQTTVAASSPMSTYGQNVTLTATVTPTATTSATPSGTVTYYDYETNPIGTVGVSTVNGTTTASLDISSLMGGFHSITATYNGDPTFGSSTSDTPANLNVAEAPTIVTVASSANPAVLGQAVVFSVTISSPASGETGFVQFVDNGIMIGSGAVSGGQATFQTGSLTLGTHPITAVYEGDDDFIGSSSANTVTQTINQGSTSTDLTSSHDPGLVGQAVTYTATVAVDAPGSGSPTGDVSFSDGGSPIPACQGFSLPPTPPLQVACSQVYDSSAAHSITATYSGDAGFIGSAGATAENIAPVPTTTSVAPSPSASTSGQSVTLTALVAPTTGAAIPDGTVTFTVDGTNLGSSTLSTVEGVTTASMLTTTLPVGSDAVIASYSGSAAFLTSSSARAAPVIVSRAPTSLGLLDSGHSSTAGQAVTLTATVFPTTGSGETGVVTFFDDGTRIGTSRVSNGQATLTISTLPAGDDLMTADYGGDASFIGSSTTT